MLFVFLAGCSALVPGKVCTLLACDKNLTVLFEGQPASSYSLTIQEAGQPDRVVNCPDTGDAALGICRPDSVYIRDYAPAGSIKIIYRAGSKEVSHDLEPQYKQLQPNGPGCGTCLEGTTAFKL